MCACSVSIAHTLTANMPKMSNRIIDRNARIVCFGFKCRRYRKYRETHSTAILFGGRFLRSLCLAALYRRNCITISRTVANFSQISILALLILFFLFFYSFLIVDNEISFLSSIFLHTLFVQIKNIRCLKFIVFRMNSTQLQTSRVCWTVPTDLFDVFFFFVGSFIDNRILFKNIVEIYLLFYVECNDTPQRGA